MSDLSVLKFGGASVASPFDFERVALIIKQRVQEGQKVVVVVSAMAKTTDQLIEMAHLVHADPSKRELDMLVSVGERISIALLAMALQKVGVEAVSLTGSQSGIITSNDHAEAKIILIKPQRVQKHLAENKVVIIAGFQGVSLAGDITTLGRGGSDTSAVALAAALKCAEVEFFKDVQGVFDKDPALYPDAQFLSSLSYEAMLLLCSQGAKVLHRRSVQLAHKNGIALCIKSFKDLSLPYTTVGVKRSQDSLEPLFEGSI